MIEWFLTREPEAQFLLLLFACGAAALICWNLYMAHGGSRWGGRLRVVRVMRYVPLESGAARPGYWVKLWDVEEWSPVASDPHAEDGMVTVFVWDWRTVETRGSKLAAVTYANNIYATNYKPTLLQTHPERRSVVMS